tara:strand:- start:655 stop:1023 length:369 start_codon:yes stop_codon:yes gene_type:complete
MHDYRMRRLVAFLTGPPEESNRNTDSQNTNSTRLVQATDATTSSAHRTEWSALKVFRKSVNVSYMLPLVLPAAAGLCGAEFESPPDGRLSSDAYLQLSTANMGHQSDRHAKIGRLHPAFRQS